MQLYKEGKYITEEPVIYIINSAGLMQGLPQVLPSGAKPYITGVAPSYGVGLALPPG